MFHHISFRLHYKTSTNYQEQGSKLQPIHMGIAYSIRYLGNIDPIILV